MAAVNKKEISPRIPSPFPPDVSYVWGESSQSVSPLRTRERNLLGAGASEKRVRDFTLGRHCAREALSKLLNPRNPEETGMVEQTGLPEILRSRGRTPLWPLDIRGSITHTGDYAAAAVAHADCYFGIGLDLERRRGGMQRLASRILRPEERELLRALPPTEQDCWLTTVFSAKESIYKALNPATGIYLGFQDASVELKKADNLEDGGFSWRLHKNCGTLLNSGFEGRGRYARRDNMVLTAVWVTGEELN